MVEMIEPYKGRVYDPASGSGGMFVMSEKFVLEHRGRINDITVYDKKATKPLGSSKMNLAIRNINSKFVAWNSEGSFLKDAHPDLKVDFILANPPFNQSDWGIDILQEDGRWKYGVPCPMETPITVGCNICCITFHQKGLWQPFLVMVL